MKGGKDDDLTGVWRCAVRVKGVDSGLRLGWGVGVRAEGEQVLGRPQRPNGHTLTKCFSSPA